MTYQLYGYNGTPLRALKHMDVFLLYSLSSMIEERVGIRFTVRYYQYKNKCNGSLNRHLTIGYKNLKINFTFLQSN